MKTRKLNFFLKSSSRDSGESFRDRDGGREIREDRAGERWMTDTPTHTILLRGLRYQIEEKDVCISTLSVNISFTLIVDSPYYFDLH